MLKEGTRLLLAREQEEYKAEGTDLYKAVLTDFAALPTTCSFLFLKEFDLLSLVFGTTAFSI